jgi:hypothetical protein
VAISATIVAPLATLAAGAEDMADQATGSGDWVEGDAGRDAGM